MGRPFRPAVRALRGGQWPRLALGPVAGLLVIACALIEARWHPVVLAYSADTAWPAALVRLPLSVIAPAQYLPWWGAVVQTTVVVALVQPALGLRRLVTVALGAHVLATLAMRVLVHLAAADVPHTWAHELDSGPSVAVLAAAAAAAVLTGGWPLAALLAAGASTELAVLHGQAGVEHVVGIAVGLACGWWWRRSVATARTTRPAATRPRIPVPVPLRRTDGLRT